MNRAYVLSKLATRKQESPAARTLRILRETQELKEFKAQQAHPHRAFARKLTREAIEKAPKAAVGALIAGAGAHALPKIIEKLTPKKSLVQQLFGKGSPGRQVLGYGLGATAIGAGIKGTEKIYDEIEGPIKKKIYFKRMLQETPALKKESPKDVANIFSTLYRFNRRMASDPLVASSFLKRSLQFKDEGIQPMDVKTLTEVAKNWTQSKPKATSLLSEALPTAASALVGFGT